MEDNDPPILDIMAVDNMVMQKARTSAAILLNWYAGNILASAPEGLTHWGWDNIAAISQTTLSNTFPWMKILEFQLKFHWSVQSTIFHHWFR